MTRADRRSLPVSLDVLGVQPSTLRGLVRRPALWSGAVGLALAMTRSGWWRHWPPRPWPSERYLAFRAQTMFGSGPAQLPPDTLVEYVKWWRRMRQLAR